MSSSLTQPVVLWLAEPNSRTRQVGRFTLARVDSSEPFWVYHYNLRDEMRLLDAWGVAPAVLQAMFTYGIPEIHYCFEGKTYLAHRDLVLQRAIHHKFALRGVPYYHLPRNQWVLSTERFVYEWARKALHLEWIDRVVMVSGASGVLRTSQLELW